MLLEDRYWKFKKSKKLIFYTSFIGCVSPSRHFTHSSLTIQGESGTIQHRNKWSMLPEIPFYVMPLFQQLQFFTTVNAYRDLPRHAGREVAFAGRSNAGKSSAINTLAMQTRLAFVSKTPGRTQHINYFRIGAEGEDRFLVDLPGYGYAKVPPAIQQHWQKLLSDYLQTWPSLKGLVLIMDCRRPFTDLDKQMLDWFAPTGKPVHVLLTKADKLTRNESMKTLFAARKALAEWSPSYTIQLFSSLKKQGVEEAENAIGAMLQDPVDPTSGESDAHSADGQ